MRKFARSHWKTILAILLAIALATMTLETGSAVPERAGAKLSTRLHHHALAIDGEPSHIAARHIDTTLAGYGYLPERQFAAGGSRAPGHIAVSVANTAPGAQPERIFIIGARYGAAPGVAHHGSGVGAVLELARLLKGMQPSPGTQVKFVFLANAQAQPASHASDSGNFIAFVGTQQSSGMVRQALAAFKAPPNAPAQGLAAPAHVIALAQPGHGAGRPNGRFTFSITDTAFLRYPYLLTAPTSPYGSAQGAAQTPGHGHVPDYAGMARGVHGLARTIDALAGASSM